MEFSLSFPRVLKIRKRPAKSTASSQCTMLKIIIIKKPKYVTSIKSQVF